ncbi:hypothetical protein [Achromobacter kerstersii]|uniref:hypothetical protein n=1 Tax=Achromobacter kerstersii TaxID=1353890 RepID=UPI0006C1308A|nr:hypothetical protein [Achromobacter kerstersii]CUJ74736.1 Uncharacterised protein [Achromobacter kerstersii]
MQESLENLLEQRYPAIFEYRRKASAGAGAPWRVMCGDGWFDLLNTLCAQLQSATDRNGAPQVVAVQVKEKFGALSFYCKDANGTQRGMIAMTAAMSARLCERCGQPGQTLVHNFLWQTRCPDHELEGAMTAEDFLSRGRVAGPAS